LYFFYSLSVLPVLLLCDVVIKTIFPLLVVLIWYSPQVGDVSGDMVLGPRIEILLGTENRRLDPHVLFAETPPVTVILFFSHVPFKDVVPPLVNDISERQKDDLVQCHRVQKIDVNSRIVHRILDQAQSLEMFGSTDREADGFSYRFVKS
jgi:hypothetical protein